LGKKTKTIILDKDYALAEAAIQLQAAGEKAYKKNDAKRLVQISYAWMQLADRFLASSQPEAEEQRKVMGFTSVEAKDE
jgi:hypothetical protein